MQGLLLLNSLDTSCVERNLPLLGEFAACLPGADVRLKRFV